MKTRRFRELLVWQHAMSLAREVYELTSQFPRNEIFGLTGQLRRAIISVPSNIAEGHGRLSDKSFAVFLGQARGSLFEVETQLELASSLGYFPADKLPALLDKCETITRMLNALLKALRLETRQRTSPADKISPDQFPRPGFSYPDFSYIRFLATRFTSYPPPASPASC